VNYAEKWKPFLHKHVIFSFVQGSVSLWLTIHEVYVLAEASFDSKKRSLEDLQSFSASLILCDSAEEFRVLPFPPKKYTPDISWDEQNKFAEKKWQMTC
jgi:hypothetical protein